MTAAGTRNLGLDVLRMAAVSLVLGRHVRMPDEPHVFLLTLSRGGWIGVDLFFVLSGFLIASLLFAEHARSGRVNTTRFLIRRGFKIYPAFWCFLVATILVRYVAKGGRPPTLPLLGEILFLQNYLGGLWDHTWSLAVEEHFYFGIAGLFAWAAKDRPGHRFEFIPSVFVRIALVCLALRLVNLLLFSTYSHQTFLYGTHIRADSLFFGVLLAYGVRYRDLAARTARIPTPILVGIGAVLLSPAFLFPLETYRWVSVVGVILFYGGSGVWVLAAIRLTASRSYVLRAFGALGAASYSIYLWHLMVGTYGWDLARKEAGLHDWPTYVAVYVIGSCTVGWMMHRIVERPALALRDRLFPRMR